MLENNRASAVYGVIQTVLLCGFALIFVADRSGWMFYSLPARTLGGVLCLAGLALMLAAFVVIRRVIQIAPAPREDAQLVTRGVYRWFRHPIYTGIVLVVIGLFLRKPTLGVAIGTVIVIAYLCLKVGIEERLLRTRYSQYADYARRTIGVLPGL